MHDLAGSRFAGYLIFQASVVLVYRLGKQSNPSVRRVTVNTLCVCLFPYLTVVSIDMRTKYGE